MLSTGAFLNESVFHTLLRLLCSLPALHVFRPRAMEHFPTVSIVNSSNVRYSAMYADDACGIETSLIYYMTIGQLLSRAFTWEDTHTPGGELIVGYSTDVVDAECTRRTVASAALLGFSAPCFTYGAVDTILPAEANAHLRKLLQQKWEPGDATGLELLVASLARSHGQVKGVYIPEASNTR